MMSAGLSNKEIARLAQGLKKGLIKPQQLERQLSDNDVARLNKQLAGGSRRIPSLPKFPDIKVSSDHVLQTCLAALTLFTILYWANNPKAIPIQPDPTRVLTQTSQPIASSTPSPDIKELCATGGPGKRWPLEAFRATYGPLPPGLNKSILNWHQQNPDVAVFKFGTRICVAPDWPPQ